MRCRFGLRQDQVIGTGTAFQERLKIGQAETPIQTVNAQRPPARIRRGLREMGERRSSRLGLVGGSHRVLEIDDGDVRPRGGRLIKAVGPGGWREQPTPDPRELILIHASHSLVLTEPRAEVSGNIPTRSRRKGCRPQMRLYAGRGEGFGELIGNRLQDLAPSRES